MNWVISFSWTLKINVFQIDWVMTLKKTGANCRNLVSRVAVAEQRTAYFHIQWAQSSIHLSLCLTDLHLTSTLLSALLWSPPNQSRWKNVWCAVGTVGDWGPGADFGLLQRQPGREDLYSVPSLSATTSSLHAVMWFLVKPGHWVKTDSACCGQKCL